MHVGKGGYQLEPHRAFKSRRLREHNHLCYPARARFVRRLRAHRALHADRPRGAVAIWYVRDRGDPMGRDDSPDRTRARDATPKAESRSQRPWWLVPIATGLLVAIVSAAIVFFVTRASVATSWYGPGNFEGNGDETVAL